VILKDKPTILEVQTLIEPKFDVTWFPEYTRWTLERDTAHVYLDYDSNYPAYHEQYLTTRQKEAIEAKLGEKPVLALHVQTSTYTPGSPELASDVVRTIVDRWDGCVQDD
jgi:hypothetical protein